MRSNAEKAAREERPKLEDRARAVGRERRAEEDLSLSELEGGGRRGLRGGESFVGEREGREIGRAHV